MLSGSLNEMFEKMNVNEDCYAVGPFSRLLANDLANMSDAKGRRKVRLLISFSASNYVLSVASVVIGLFTIFLISIPSVFSINLD